jgi:hypothetical protein
MSFIIAHMPSGHVHIPHMHTVAVCVACFFTGTAFGWITCAICTAAKGGFGTN